MIPARVLHRAATRYTVAGDCWISTYKTGNHGYAQLGWTDAGKSTVVLAHRAAWEAANGPIPDGMTVDHICFERRCVNPAHLRLLTHAENAGRRRRKWPRRRGECGHMLSIYADHDIKPWCKQCWRNRQAA